MYRIVEEYGKKGVEVLDDDNRITRFFSHSEIAINNRLEIPSDLEKDAVPNFERSEHYRVSQLYYYHNRTKKLAAELRKSPEELEISPEASFKLEIEFRFKYYKQYIENKIKDYILNKKYFFQQFSFLILQKEH